MIRNKITPFSDNDMVYDTKKHRYVLTVEAVKERLDLDLILGLGNIKKANLFLEELSKDMYRYVYSRYYRTQKKVDVLEYLMAKDGDIRENILDAMLAYVRASRRGNYNIIKDINPIDNNGFNVINSKKVEKLPPAVIEELKMTSLLHPGDFMFRVSDDDYRKDY